MNARRLVRVIYHCFVRLSTWIVSVPANVYCALYVGLALNRVIHSLGFSPQTQIDLLPRRLPVSRRLMRQPYWVALDAIRWGGRPSGGEVRKGAGLGHGLVFDGDWDVEDKRDIEQYLNEYIYSKTVYQLFRDKVSYTQTEQYREMSDFVSRGLTDHWQARGCRNERDIEAYFDGLVATFEAIRDHGYQSQEHLGSDCWYDEVKVFVDRAGELHKQQAAGHHRLAMARILKVPRIPVIVIGVHRQWAITVQRRLGLDVVSAIDSALCELCE